MTWENAIKNLYKENNITLYKRTMILYQELVCGDYQLILSEVNKKIETTYKNLNRDTQQTLMMKRILKENTDEQLKNSKKMVEQSFKSISNYNNLNSLKDHFIEVKYEPYFMLINKLRGNGEISAFFGEQLSREENEDNSGKLKNKVWICKAPSLEEYNRFITNNVIKIFYSEYPVGDLSQYKTIDEISNKTPELYIDGNLRVNARAAFWNISHTMKKGDVVYISESNNKIRAKGNVSGDYYYDEASKCHLLPVQFLENFQSHTTEIIAQKALTNITDRIQMIEEIEKNSQNPIYIKADFIETGYKQLIIDGAPGTGKSYHVNKNILAGSKLYERVTFYSDYEYHNFIGSILPKLNGETVTYEFVKGPFTKLLNDALSNPEDKHYLIVEELTRGNAAAIFGDIFQLLDRDEEGWSEYPITHNNILESVDPEVRTFLENEYEGKVVLPPNLSIICTINSSDQNVYPLDTAFKRRFDYKIESTNVHSDFVDYKIKFGTDTTVSWLDFYQKLNKYILVDLRLKEDKQVGPYFIKNHKDDNKKLESIQTKLAMYMWNDLHKVHTISNKTIFEDVHTLYEVDNLFRTGSREQILNVLSEEFKQCLNLNDVSDLTE